MSRRYFEELGRKAELLLLGASNLMFGLRPFRGYWNQNQITSNHRVFNTASTASTFIILSILFLSKSIQERRSSISLPRNSNLRWLSLIVLYSGISAGAYAALISWIQGYQYTLPLEEPDRFRSENHQFTPYVPFGILRVRLPARVTDLRALFPRIPATADYLPWEGSVAAGDSTWVLGFVRWRATAGWSNLNESLTKTIGRKDSPRFVFDQEPTRGWSKGDQETFRRGAMVRAETPSTQLRDRFRKWNSRVSYRQHPYWTDNLKYV
jgi:hypothetical protein